MPYCQIPNCRFQDCQVQLLPNNSDFGYFNRITVSRTYIADSQIANSFLLRLLKQYLLLFAMEKNISKGLNFNEKGTSMHLNTEIINMIASVSGSWSWSVVLSSWSPSASVESSSGTVSTSTFLVLHTGSISFVFRQSELLGHFRYTKKNLGYRKGNFFW